MLPAGEPKFKRRKADRPEEIVAAAFEVFGEKGFAAARLDDIAARAGVSKGAVYLYFATKEDIFRAVVEQGIEPHLRTVQTTLTLQPQPLPDLLRGLAPFMSHMISETPIGGIIKVVIGEARNFPELARIWHDRLIAVALGTLTAAIAGAQARGEMRPGDPRHYALSLVSPMLVSVIWRETFVPIGAEPFDPLPLANQHIELWLSGMMNPPGAQP